VPVALRPFHVHHHVLARQPDLHRHVEHLALMMMAMRCVHHHAARLNAVAEHVQVIGETPHTRLDRG
jgi:hypothetical protein